MNDVKELVEELRTTANEAESALDLTGFVAGALGWPHDISDSSLRTLLGATLRDFVKFFHEANLFVLVPREAADLLEQQAQTIAVLHMLLQDFNAVTDPEEHPDLKGRVDAYLNDCEDAGCKAWHAMERAVVEAENKAEQQAETIRRLREGLKYLAAETKGLLGIAAEEVRAAVGVTNVNCLRRRTEEALVLLRETGRPVGEGE